MEHTPAPWRAWSQIVKSPFGEESKSPAWYVTGGTDKPGGRLFVTVGYEHVNSQNAANARLMAAAPELLAACHAAFDLIERVGDERKDAPVLGALADAIRKAERGD